MRLSTNVFAVVCTMLMTQLSLTMALTHRHFRMSYLNNGACVLINSTSPDTSIRFNFYGIKGFEVPMMVFDYSEVLYFKNVPNLNYFLNHTYVLREGWDLINFEDGKVEFLIEPRKADIGLPPSYSNQTIGKDGSIQYRVPKDGVYCIYFPVYKSGPQSYLPGRYIADVEIVNETYPLNVFQDISIHVSLSIVFGIVLVFISFFHPTIAKGQLFKLPLITRSIVYILVISFIYSTVFFLLEIVCAYYPTDVLYKFTEETYFNFQRGLIGKLPNYVSVLVYLGYGFSNLEFKPFIRFTTFVFIVHVLASLYGDYVVGNVSSLVDILFLGDRYSILYKTILVYGNYRNAYLGFTSEREKAILGISSILQVSTEVLLFVIASIHAGIIYFKLRVPHPQAARKILISYIVHFVIYKLAIKQALIFFTNISFAGVFDVGESLKVFGDIIEGRELKLIIINLIEIILVWILWGTNRLIDVRKEIKESDKKAAVTEKSAAIAKKVVDSKGKPSPSKKQKSNTESKKRR